MIQFFSLNDDVDARQPETKAIIRWLKEKHFTASASLHGVIRLYYSYFLPGCRQLQLVTAITLLHVITLPCCDINIYAFAHWTDLCKYVYMPYDIHFFNAFLMILEKLFVMRGDLGKLFIWIFYLAFFLSYHCLFKILGNYSECALVA